MKGGTCSNETHLPPRPKEQTLDHAEIMVEGVFDSTTQRGFVVFGMRILLQLIFYLLKLSLG